MEINDEQENETLMDELWGEDNDLVSECTVVVDTDLDRLFDEIRKAWNEQRPLLVRFGGPNDLVPGVVAQYFMDECKRLNDEIILLVTELRAKQEIIEVLKDNNLLTRLLGLMERDKVPDLSEFVKSIPTPPSMNFGNFMGGGEEGGCETCKNKENEDHETEPTEPDTDTE